MEKKIKDLTKEEIDDLRAVCATSVCSKCSLRSHHPIYGAETVPCPLTIVQFMNRKIDTSTFQKKVKKYCCDIVDTYQFKFTFCPNCGSRIKKDA